MTLEQTAWSTMSLYYSQLLLNAPADADVGIKLWVAIQGERLRAQVANDDVALAAADKRLEDLGDLAARLNRLVNE